VACHQVERTSDGDQKQRHQFRYRENVADMRARAHTAIVDQRQDAEQKKSGIAGTGPQHAVKTRRTANGLARPMSLATLEGSAKIRCR
jgi:hypothetical protein